MPNHKKSSEKERKKQVTSSESSSSEEQQVRNGRKQDGLRDMIIKLQKDNTTLLSLVMEMKIQMSEMKTSILANIKEQEVSNAKVVEILSKLHVVE